MASIYTYNLLTPADDGADVLLANSTLEITGAPFVNLKEATVSQFNDPVTDVREVVVLTPTNATAIGQVYSFNITQFVKSLGRYVTKTFSYTSQTASDTNTTISLRLKQLVDLDSELAVTATSTTTLSITADAASSDITVTIISTGAGFSQASSFVNSAGGAVSPAATYTAGTASNLVTVTRGASGTQTNFAAGMIVNITLTGSDTITLSDGTVVTPATGAYPVRIGGTISNGAGVGDTFQFGPTTDANIVAASVVSAPVVAATARPARGTAADLASRGVVGAASSTIYAEVKLNWLETPANGGAPISKSHSVFVDTTTSAAQYTEFRFAVLNAMRAVTRSISAFNTTAEPEASAIN